MTCGVCGADAYETGEVATYKVCEDNPTHVTYSHLSVDDEFPALDALIDFRP